MLRKVAPIGLLLGALLFLTWVSVSFTFDLGIMYTSSNGRFAVSISRSVTLAWSTRTDVWVTVPGFTRNPYEIHSIEDAYAWPYPRGTIRRLKCPFWFLGALCLAWPFASFIAARRRRTLWCPGQRGFPVEPKADESSSSDASARAM